MLINIILLVVLLIILIPVLWVVWAIFYVAAIEPFRKRYSYLVSCINPREPGDGFTFSYYEKDEELMFFGDDIENTIFMPDEELWKSTMPEFFRDRYHVIMERLRRKMGRRISVKIVDDYSKGCTILYCDHSKPFGGDRTIQFGVWPE